MLGKQGGTLWSQLKSAAPAGLWKGRNCLPLLEVAGNLKAALGAFLVMFIGANFAQLHPEVGRRARFLEVTVVDRGLSLLLGAGGAQVSSQAGLLQGCPQSYQKWQRPAGAQCNLSV